MVSSSPSMASPSPSPSYASSLPVASLREKIIEKIKENRVTFIIGETGCGKSSQIPQFLLEENMVPILCTQPRRFAVVTIAEMVATTRKCVIGDEVGYHIGHSKKLSSRTKIFFKTAGVLLEEMFDKGKSALEYNVIILDEVHERSVESDLVLACVKQFLLKNNDLRVVLMSATADISKYRDYFRDLGRDERLEVLAIPSSSKRQIFQRKVLYLEQIADLGIDSESLSEDSSNDVIVTEDIDYRLINNLVLHIHLTEPDIEKSILIFLPTYRSLEQQWFILSSFHSYFKIQILHSCIDTEQALVTMQPWKSQRKVILATNIAESSVTIPGVAFVIDSCRTLGVCWDNARKREFSELTWVSKSQAEQRKGRTGRTCDGEIYRLVRRSFFQTFVEHESPSILKLSLRKQVLMISCANSRAINDPKVLLQKVLDPVNPKVIKDALDFLVNIQALKKAVSPKGRFEPTFYGRLLASLPLSLDTSMLVIKFGEMGLLREGILIGILLEIQPLPIAQPFGQHLLSLKYLHNYYGESDIENFSWKRDSVALGNLCAFQFWQRAFKDKHRLEHLKEVMKSNSKDIEFILKLEEEWCHLHHLVQTSLHNVSKMYNDVLHTMHKFRPRFLVTSKGIPSYYEPYGFKHTCCLHSSVDVESLTPSFENFDLYIETTTPPIETKDCLASPYVAAGDFCINVIAEKLVEAIAQIRVMDMEDTSENQYPMMNDVIPLSMNEAPLCKFFIRGCCNKGILCEFSHSLQAMIPVCKFFFSLQGCRNGDSCLFSHHRNPSIFPLRYPSLCTPEEIPIEEPLLEFLPTKTEGSVLLLDDKNLHFSSYLARYFNPSQMIAITPDPYTSVYSLPTDVQILWDIDLKESVIHNEQETKIPWKKIQCVFLYVKFESDLENERQSGRLDDFFKFMSVRILSSALYNIQVILTMNNIRFAQLQVEKMARECFFFLSNSFSFDESSFGPFPDELIVNRPMMVPRIVSYVFVLHPPPDWKLIL